MRNKYKHIEIIAISIIIVVVAIIPKSCNGNECFVFNTDLSIYSNYAQYLSVVISIVTIYFVYRTFTTQQEQLKESSRQRFESVFYGEMLPKKDKILTEPIFGDEKDLKAKYNGEFILNRLIVECKDTLHCLRRFNDNILEYATKDGQLQNLDCRNDIGKISEAIKRKTDNVNRNFTKAVINAIQRYDNTPFIDFYNKRHLILKDIAIEQIKNKARLQVNSYWQYFKFVKLMLKYVYSSKNVEGVDFSDLLLSFISYDELLSIFLLVTTHNDKELKSICETLNLFSETYIKKPNNDLDEEDDLYLFLKDEYTKI